MVEKDAGKLVEIGVIYTGAFDEIDQQATDLAVSQFTDFVEATFPELRWRLISLRRPESISAPRIAPSLLLQQALEERDEQHWDFAFVLTSAELESHYSTHCFAALSRPLDAAVFSLSLIDPQATGESTNETQRIERIAQRLSRLMLHALGHLLGLSPHQDPANLLYHPSRANELDPMRDLDASQIDKQRDALTLIADQRLEEQPGKRNAIMPFALRSAWINAREIGEAIFAARPWQFPRRLSGLTLAAASTLVILLMTAESWDLALSQSPARMMALVVAAWAGTTVYVVFRQQLIVSSRNQRSEQIVVTSFSAMGIVFTGMFVTWVLLLSAALAVICLLFQAEVIASWAASAELAVTDIGFRHRLQMAGFAASLGLMIGALGASFESQHYFRHIIFVDEEIG